MLGRKQVIRIWGDLKTQPLICLHPTVCLISGYNMEASVAIRDFSSAICKSITL